MDVSKKPKTFPLKNSGADFYLEEHRERKRIGRKKKRALDLLAY